MNELEAILKFFQTPKGLILRQWLKDSWVNYAFPALRNYMSGAFQTPNMSTEEQERRAREEFATVNKYDIESTPTNQPEPPAPNQKPDDKDKGKT